MIKIIIGVGLLGLLQTIAHGQVHPKTYNAVIAGFTNSIYSVVLSETRKINIYLPEEYSPDSANSYPVIYLLDGGAKEDFVHIAGLVKFAATPWVKMVPPSIVVGIENVNRKRDFTFMPANLNFFSRMGMDKSSFPEFGGSAKFISFIETELQPYINKNYKTNTSRTLIGESLAGLLATEILLKKSSLFDTYIIISPGLWWDNASLLFPKSTSFIHHPNSKILKLYIGAPNKNEEIIMYNDAKHLADVLKHYKTRVKVFFDYIPAETHATVIHQAVYNAFKLINTPAL